MTNAIQTSATDPCAPLPEPFFIFVEKFRETIKDCNEIEVDDIAGRVHIEFKEKQFDLSMDCTISDHAQPMIQRYDDSHPVKLPEVSEYYRPLVEAYKAAFPEHYDNAQKRLFTGEANGGEHPYSWSGISRLVHSWKHKASKRTIKSLRNVMVNANLKRNSS